MDNLTHSVVGLGVGALIDRSLRPEPDSLAQRGRSRLLLTIGCLASNFPDLDLVFTGLLEPPLGYLLHHRGHTHTLLAAIVEVALLLALVWLLWPAARRLLRASRPARRGALAAACAGLVLHLSMDALNVYGVHPFWPVDPDWYYGDLVFIVEPVFWIAFGMPLAAMVYGHWRRRLLLGLMVAVPLGVTLAGFLQWGSLAGLLAMGAALAWVQRHVAENDTSRRRRAGLAAGLAASLAFVGVQATAMHQARAIVAAEVKRLDPGERLLDTALSAFPANPLCWSFVTVAKDEASGSYHLRRGLLSIAPALSGVESCPAPIAGRASPKSAAEAALAPANALHDGAGLAWLSDERQSLAALRTLAQDNCHFNAWMRFARAPALVGALATDIRWSPSGSRNFSTIDYGGLAQSPCPAPVPGWGYPRADLLTKATGPR